MKYPFIILFIAVSIFCSINSFAQNSKEDKQTEYGGKVLNKETGEALQGVVILFTDPKTGQMSGTITSEKGEFKITIPKAVPYLTFSLPGVGKEKLILSEVDSTKYLKIEILLGEKNK